MDPVASPPDIIVAYPGSFTLKINSYITMTSTALATVGGCKFFGTDDAEITTLPFTSKSKFYFTFTPSAAFSSITQVYLKCEETSNSAYTFSSNNFNF